MIFLGVVRVFGAKLGFVAARFVVTTGVVGVLVLLTD